MKCLCLVCIDGSRRSAPDSKCVADDERLHQLGRRIAAQALPPVLARGIEVRPVSIRSTK